MSTGFSKDSKNPYRTGVLVGNHTEDRFGQEISAKPVILSFATIRIVILHFRNNSNPLRLSNVQTTTLVTQCLHSISNLRTMKIYW
jgi:hypothetical protein